MYRTLANFIRGSQSACARENHYLIVWYRQIMDIPLEKQFQAICHRTKLTQVLFVKVYAIKVW